MANELISGVTLVDYSTDVPMTVNEVLFSNTLVEIVNDIPMTVNEVNLNFTIVEGVNDIPPRPSIKRSITSGGKCVLGKIV